MLLTSRGVGKPLRKSAQVIVAAVARPWEGKFLGYSLRRHKAPKLKIAPSSLKRQEDKIREALNGARGRRLTAVIAEFNPILRGWAGYLKLTEENRAQEKRDGWIRRKLRCILWRQWKRPYLRQELDEGGTDGGACLAFCVRPTRAVVQQWRQPHEPGVPEVHL